MSEMSLVQGLREEIELLNRKVAIRDAEIKLLELWLADWKERARIVGEDVTQEQVGEIAKLLTEPSPQYKVGDWVEFIDAVKSRGIPGEMGVLIAVLRHGFAMRDRKHLAEEMINTITK